MEKMPDQFNILELMGKCEEKTPYIVVCFQECERMNVLTAEVKRSLKELDLGLKGELTMNQTMEDLSNSLFFDQVKFINHDKRKTYRNVSGSLYLDEIGLCLS